jgi:hypothetical protein
MIQTNYQIIEEPCDDFDKKYNTVVNNIQNELQINNTCGTDTPNIKNNNMPLTKCNTPNKTNNDNISGN